MTRCQSDWSTLFRERTLGPNEHIVEIEDLGISFGGVTAVSDFTYAVQQAEFLAVVGQNGAGKTTLLNSISGLVRPTKGQVRINGVGTVRLRTPAIARLGVGRSFQDPKLLDSASVLENLMLGEQFLQDYGLFAQLFQPRRVVRSEKVAAEKALNLLDMAGLRHLAHEQVVELSFGLRKVVDLLRAFMGRPTLLLLDEPSSGLDTEEQDSVKRILEAVRETQAVSAIIVEHHWDVVRDTTDRVLVLENGRELMSGPPAEIFGSSTFRNALVGARVADRAE